MLVNDRALLNLFFTVFIFFTRYSPVLVILLQLLHLPVGLILVTASSGSGAYQCSCEKLASRLRETCYEQRYQDKFFHRNLLILNLQYCSKLSPTLRSRRISDRSLASA